MIIPSTPYSEEQKEIIEKFSRETGIPTEIAGEVLDQTAKQLVTAEYFRIEVLGDLYSKVLLTFLDDSKEHQIADLHKVFVTSPDGKWRMTRFSFNYLIGKLNERKIIEKGDENIKIGEEGLKILAGMRKDGYNLEKVRRGVNPLYNVSDSSKVYESLLSDLGMVVEGLKDLKGKGVF